MLRFLRWLFIYLPLSLLAIVVLAFTVTWYAELVPRSDLKILADTYEKEGVPKAWGLVRNELFGPSSAQEADPSYGRFYVAGRGHSPWVLRGNLDGRTRVLKLALAPGVWAAYHLEYASLYQVWEGEVLFEGSVYDYRHGPQPISKGRAYLRNDTPVQWYLVDGDSQRKANVRYLGHDYTLGGDQVAIRYVVKAGRKQVEVHEYPALVESDQGLTLERRFEYFSGDKNVTPVAVRADGSRLEAVGTVSTVLDQSIPIVAFKNPDRGGDADAAGLEAGRKVIANSDCLGCHAETHRIAGPAWAEVAQRYSVNLKE